MIPDKVMYIRFQVISLLVNPFIRQPAFTAVILQCPFAAIHKNTQILIIQQQFAVDAGSVFLFLFYPLFQIVESVHDTFHPRIEMFFIYKHNSVL
jgi:hypothetical protein